MRKGQLTPFIILGLIVVVVIILGISLRKEIVASIMPSEAAEAMRLQQETDEVRYFVENCMEDIARNAVLDVLDQGGFLELNDRNSIWAYALRIPYYSINGDERAPSLWDYENALESYVNIMIVNCIRDFSEFSDSGFNVEELARPLSDLSLSTGTILVNTEYSLRITKGNQSEKIKEFSTELEIEALAPFHEAAELFEKVKDGKMTEPELADYVNGKDYNLAADYVANTTIYALMFSNLRIKDEEVIVPFGIKTDAIETEAEEDEEIEALLSLPDLFEEEIPDAFDEPLPEEFIGDEGMTGGLL